MRHFEIISHTTIDVIISAAIAMGVASPVPTATDTPVIDDLTAVTIGKILLTAQLTAAQSTCTPDDTIPGARLNIDSYRFTNEGALPRRAVFANLAAFDDVASTAPNYSCSLAGTFVSEVAMKLISQTIKADSRTPLADRITPG
jgi:hypothetical protein